MRVRFIPSGVWTFIIILIIICLSVYLIYGVTKEHRTCNAFASWQQVQKLYEFDPERYKAFDKDKDGIACEFRRN